jgi:hypothetical protein
MEKKSIFSSGRGALTESRGLATHINERTLHLKLDNLSNHNVSDLQHSMLSDTDDPSLPAHLASANLSNLTYKDHPPMNALPNAYLEGGVEL